MPGEHIVFDGLWRCLCPSLDATTFSGMLRAPSIARRRPFAHVQPRRRLAAAHAQHHGTLNGPLSGPRREEKDSRRETQSSREFLDASYSRYIQRVWRRNAWIPPALLRGQLSEDRLGKLEVNVLVEALRELMSLESQYHTICQVVRHLVTKRGRKPDAFLYQCLIRANVDPRHGSARVVADLLQEMRTRGVSPTNAVYHAVLDVLAVHPDYVLRNEVLREMRQAWHAPSSSGQVSIVVGLLRDGQHEMALEKLEELDSSGVPIPFWLYDIFIFAFGELGIHDETLMILQRRLRDPEASVPHNIWFFLLDVFAQGAYYEGISYVWNRMVLSGRLVPSDGTAIHVLDTAARHGNASLAMQVIEMLLSRGRRLAMHHFEPLLEIQAATGDLRKAFTTICIMAKAGLQPDLSSTRAVFQQLQDSTSRTREAITILQDLKYDHHVPIAAFNTVLQAKLLQDGQLAGLDLYRALGGMCSDAPDLETFKLLLERCTLHKTLGFIRAEMEVFDVRPDEALFNRMILISTLNSNYEPAFRFLNKMRRIKTAGHFNNWYLDEGTALALIRRCIMAEDSRLHGVLVECKRRGMTGVLAETGHLLEQKRLTVPEGKVQLEVARPEEGARPQAISATG